VQAGPLEQEEDTGENLDMLQIFVVANHPDAAVLKRLEVQQFQDSKKKPGGKKIPAGQSYLKEKETRGRVITTATWRTAQRRAS
jgi:hypothetical protein